MARKYWSPHHSRLLLCMEQGYSPEMRRHTAQAPYNPSPRSSAPPTSAMLFQSICPGPGVRVLEVEEVTGNLATSGQESAPVWLPCQPNAAFPRKLAEAISLVRCEKKMAGGAGWTCLVMVRGSPPGKSLSEEGPALSEEKPGRPPGSWPSVTGTWVISRAP